MSPQSNIQLFDGKGNKIPVGNELGAGGEGTVYDILSGYSQSKLVAKVYHNTHLPTPDKVKKLMEMVKTSNADLINIAAWPCETVHFSRGGKLVGFLMPSVVGYKEIHKLYQTSSRKQYFPKADWSFLIVAARNFAAAMAKIHLTGNLIGDVNSNNVQVSTEGLVKLIDCDSFQIGALYLCEVGVPEFTSPELQGKIFANIKRSPNNDNFGLAIMVFYLLFLGFHPYMGVFEGGNRAIELPQSISEYRFAYSRRSSLKNIKPPSMSIPSIILPSYVMDLFERAFSEDGTKLGRPTAKDWVTVLDKLKNSLTTCTTNKNHKYCSVLKKCPWCDIEYNLRTIYFLGNTQNLSSIYSDLSLLYKALITKYQGIGDPKSFNQPIIPIYISKIMKYDSSTYNNLKQKNIISSNKWKTLCNELTILNDRVNYVRKSNTVEKLRREYHEIDKMVVEDRKKLYENAHYIQLESFMQKHLIEDAVNQGLLTNIGKGKLYNLQAHNIISAWDVKDKDVEMVTGFGIKLKCQLEAWANSVQNKFIFNKSVAVDASRLQLIDQKYIQRRKRIIGALESSIKEIELIVGTTNSKGEKAVSDMRNIANDLAQATADLKKLEELKIIEELNKKKEQRRIKKQKIVYCAKIASGVVSILVILSIVVAVVSKISNDSRKAAEALRQKQIAEQGKNAENERIEQERLEQEKIEQEKIKQEKIETVKRFAQAAEQGDALGQIDLGNCYYYGNGVKQDYAEAVKWYRKAAEQGNQVAQNALGRRYELGEGVNPDSVEAVNWYRKAAEQNDAYGQMNLARHIYQGKGGVEKDLNAAVELFHKSALQGNTYAIGWMKELGYKTDMYPK